MEGRPKFCPHCGASLDMCQRFCTKCGVHLPEITPSEPTANSQSQNNCQQSYNNPQQQSYSNDQQIHNYDYQPYNYNLQQPYGYNGQQPMYPPQKNSTGGLTAVSVITILLAILALTLGLADMYVWYTTDDPSLYYKNTIATIGILYILLFIAGLIGGIVSARRKNWGLGFGSYIAALVILVVIMAFDLDVWTLVGVGGAVALLVIFIKNKPHFV